MTSEFMKEGLVYWWPVCEWHTVCHRKVPPSSCTAVIWAALPSQIILMVHTAWRLFSRSLNFVDGCLYSFRWINFAVLFPHAYTTYHTRMKFSRMPLNPWKQRKLKALCHAIRLDCFVIASLVEKTIQEVTRPVVYGVVRGRTRRSK